MKNEILGYECMTKGCGIVTQYLLDICPKCKEKDWRAIVTREKIELKESPSAEDILDDWGYVKPEYLPHYEAEITLDGVSKRKFQIKKSDASMQGDKTGVVHRVRIIDKINDRYVEKVAYLDTGTIIRDCDEKLTEHYGHGSDNKKTT